MSVVQPTAAVTAPQPTPQPGPYPPGYQVAQPGPYPQGYPVAQPGPYPQGYAAAQPGQIIIVQSQGIVGPRVYENYARLTSKILGIGRIGFGVLSIIFTVVTIIVDVETGYWGPRTTSVAGTGIWCGLFFILAGAFGVAAASTKTMCLIVTNMVLSIISVGIFGVTFLALSATGIAMADANYGSYCHYCARHQTNYDYHESLRTRRALIALFSVMIVLALAECVCDIWSSVICCKAVCCGFYASAPNQQVQYIAAPPVQHQANSHNPNLGSQLSANTNITATGGYHFQSHGGTPAAAAGRDGDQSPPPAYGADNSQEKQAPPI